MKLNRLISTSILCFGLAACSSETAINSAQSDLPATEKQLGNAKSPLTTLAAPSQFLTVNGQKGGKLKGKKGTKLTIPPSAFVTLDGKAVSGPVQVELREALSSKDIVCSGLQTVTHDGKTLETGGMIYLDAKAEGQPLKIAEGKAVKTEVPATKVDKRMMVWEGEEADGKIVWKDPRKIETPVVKVRKVEVGREVVSVIIDKPLSSVERTLLFYDSDGDTLGKTPRIKPGEIDSSIWSENDTRYVGDVPSLAENLSPIEAYLFSVTKLGWSNIDCFYDDKRVKDIRFSVSVEMEKEFNSINAYLLPRSKKVYLSGYERKDGIYYFNHSDEGEVSPLPVGEKALLVFSGFKGTDPYFGTREITIGDREVEKITLEKTTPAEMEKQLDKVL